MKSSLGRPRLIRLYSGQPSCPHSYTAHGEYPDIGIAIDRVIQATGRTPTIVLSGHVHSYQRFE